MVFELSVKLNFVLNEKTRRTAYGYTYTYIYIAHKFESVNV